MHVSTTLFASTLVALSGFASAQPMEVKLESPSAIIRIPDIEAFDLGAHPNKATQPTARLFGSKGTTTLSVLAPTSGPDTSPLQCASWLAGNVLSRFAPPLDSVQFVKARENAFVLVFPLRIAGLEQLKAFVVTGNGKGHCVEVHISRLGATEKERVEWLAGFRSVRVEAQ